MWKKGVRRCELNIYIYNYMGIDSHRIHWLLVDPVTQVVWDWCVERWVSLGGWWVSSLHHSPSFKHPIESPKKNLVYSGWIAVTLLGGEDSLMTYAATITNHLCILTLAILGQLIGDHDACKMISVLAWAWIGFVVFCRAQIGLNTRTSAQVRLWDGLKATV